MPRKQTKRSDRRSPPPVVPTDVPRRARWSAAPALSGLLTALRGGKPGWGWPDWIVLAGLAALSCWLRWPHLNRLILNVDEAEYMASAAFFADAHQSPFQFSAFPWTLEVYKLAAVLFGPYVMWPVRAAVLLAVTAIAGLLYRIVATETARWCGLITAIYFLRYNMLYEGLSANREWPASLMLAAGLYLLARSQRPQGRSALALAGVAGVVTGLAFCFKEQVAYMTLAPMAYFVVQAAVTRKWQETGLAALAYVGGGLTAGLIYIAPFIAAGTLGQHLETIRQFSQTYAAENTQGAAGITWQDYANFFYLKMAHRPLLAIIYLFACASLGSLVTQAAGRPGSFSKAIEGPGARLALFYLPAAMLSMQMGGRFFKHYYLLLMPYLALLLGYAAYYVIHLAPRNGFGIILRLAALLGLMQSFRTAPWMGWGILLFAGWCLWDGLRSQQWRPSVWLRTAVAAVMILTIVAPWGLDRILTRDFVPALTYPAPRRMPTLPLAFVPAIACSYGVGVRSFIAPHGFRRLRP